MAPIFILIFGLFRSNSAQTVTFQFTPGNQRVAEESGAVQVCVEQLNGTVSNETLIILLNPTAGSAGDSDFDITSRPVSFPPGSTAGSVQCTSFSILDDGIQEIEEHFSVTSDRADLFFGTVVTVIIVDNDGERFQFVTRRFRVTEGSDARVCVLQVSGLLTQSLSFILRTSGGSRANAADFRIGETSTVVFPPGSATNSTVCVTFITNDDVLVEAIETFFVNTNEVQLLNAPALVEIVDNDAALLQFPSPVITVRESESVATVSLQLVVLEEISPRISVLFSIPTTGTSATVGWDFLGNAKLARFGNSRINTVSFNVTILNDDVAEPTEEFIVTVMVSPNQNGMAFFGVDNLSQNATVIIIDDDDPVNGTSCPSGTMSRCVTTLPSTSQQPSLGTSSNDDSLPPNTTSLPPAASDNSPLPSNCTFENIIIGAISAAAAGLVVALFSSFICCIWKCSSRKSNLKDLSSASNQNAGAIGTRMPTVSGHTSFVPVPVPRGRQGPIRIEGQYDGNYSEIGDGIYTELGNQEATLTLGENQECSKNFALERNHAYAGRGQ